MIFERRKKLSVTEWVLKVFDSKEGEDLEEAKNFVFIWNLFENQSSEKIFTNGLKIEEFKNWAKNLKIINTRTSISLHDEQTENTIDKNLIENIDNAFNYFHQEYMKSNDDFTDKLFDQSIPSVQNDLNRFKDFYQSIDTKDIRDKIIFLFFVAKRMRNKFFHGIKQIGEIKDDQKKFKKINEYLIAIISLLESY